jgi:serine/threonine protein kinase
MHLANTSIWNDSLSTLAERPGAGGPLAVRIGSTVGGYRLEALLGSGGMGTVFAARQLATGRRVALKAPTRRARRGARPVDDRLLREAGALAAVRHRAVIGLEEIVRDGDRLCLAMELVEGETLLGWRASERPGWRAMTRVMTEVARALAATHDAGLLHRDVKPDNIMVDRAGRARLLDFGLARRFADRGADSVVAHVDQLAGNPSLTDAGQLIGTPAYMSPEQLTNGTVSPASDQFGFCITLHHLLYGRRPFDGDSCMAVVAAILDDLRAPVPDDASVPHELRALIERGLSRDPNDRYGSMLEVATELERIASRRWWSLMR